MKIEYKRGVLNPTEIKKVTGIKVKSVETSIEGIFIEVDEIPSNIEKLDKLLVDCKRDGAISRDLAAEMDIAKADIVKLKAGKMDKV